MLNKNGNISIKKYFTKNGSTKVKHTFGKIKVRLDFEKEKNNSFIDFELFTGKLDSNKTKIFTGDIISIPSYYRNGDENNSPILFHVFYSNDDAMFLLEPFVKGAYSAPLIGIQENAEGFNFLDDFYPYFEVIGNIHENKELLGQVKYE